MKNKRLDELANEITVISLGSYDDYPDEDVWFSYKNGVRAGLLDMLSSIGDVRNQSLSLTLGNDNFVKLQKAIKEFSDYLQE